MRRGHTTGISVVWVGTQHCLSWQERMHTAYSWLVAQPLGHVHVHMGIQRGAQWAVVLQLGRKPEAGALFGGLDSYVLCLGTWVCHP